jgi:ClpP class serine protease
MLTKTNFLFDTIWGINENELLEIITVYQSLQTGKDINPAGFKTDLFPGKPIFEERDRELQIIRIDGKLVFYQNPFLTMISSTSVFKVLEILSVALKMDLVKEIVLDINSPGGSFAPALILSELFLIAGTLNRSSVSLIMSV